MADDRATRLRHYARRFRLRSLVETGTYMGDMVWAMRRQFDEIYSVELDAKLHARAVERFKSNPHIHLYQGDSAKVLGDVIPRLNGPSLFWLDGHYSAGVTAKGESETPVMSEIGHVLDDSRWAHVILVDDARCFGQGEYPAVDDLRTLIATRRDLALEVTEDVIRILPKQ